MAEGGGPDRGDATTRGLGERVYSSVGDHTGGCHRSTAAASVDLRSLQGERSLFYYIYSLLPT